MARVLAAVAPDAEERVRRILSGHELHFVTDLAGAKAALDEAVDLVFVGARFDESRMFDLLDYIRKDASYSRIPIVAAIVAPIQMREDTVRGLAHTTKIFGASVFVNLNDFADQESGNARIRIIVETVLLPPDLVPEAADQLASSTRG